METESKATRHLNKFCNKNFLKIKKQIDYLPKKMTIIKMISIYLINKITKIKMNNHTPYLRIILLKLLIIRRINNNNNKINNKEMVG